MRVRRKLHGKEKTRPDVQGMNINLVPDSSPAVAAYCTESQERSREDWCCTTPCMVHVSPAVCH